MKLLQYFSPNRRLAFKMILYIFSSIGMIFFLIFLYNYNISRKIVRKNLITNAENLTSLTVSKIENVLNSVQKIPQNFAKIIETSDYSKEELINLLYQMVNNNPEIYGAALAFEPYYYDSSQKYYSPYFYRHSDEVLFKYLGDEKYNYFMMDWYQIPKELNRAMWSEPYFDEGAGNTIMSTYSVPFYKDNNGKKEFLGILTADISLDWLQDYMNSIKIYETGYGYMISSNGTIVTHPDKEMIMNETIFSIADTQKSPMLRQIGKNMINGEVSFAEFEYRNVHTGKLSWLAYAPVTLNNWSVGIVFPVDEFMADVNNLVMRLFLFCLLGLLIILAVIILISGSITRPLRKLTAAVGRFAEGDFNIELPEIRSHDEIGTLNDSFIYMQKELATTISDLKETSEKLKLSNDKLEDYSRTLEQKVKERTAELFEKNEKLNTAFSNVKTLNEIGKKLTSTLNTGLIQDIIYENANSLMDAATLLIMIYNEKERKLECKLSTEKGNKLPPFEISMDEKNRFAVWCVNNASPVFMNDVDTEYVKYIPDRPAPKAGERVSSLIYLPLMIENRITGVISVQSFKKNAYSQYHLDMLNNLANYIAIAFENALSYEKINKANRDLKAAQAQIIQSEKMASLGQLTAGIAHEIKNPLNFINNFSDLTAELAEELKEEFEKLAGRILPDDKEYLQQITDDISANVKKINEHGKRADRIIKGMLLHSRGKSGDKQPTDINALLAESMNLAYHSMRAHDNSFNIKMETDYDPAIGNISVVPQNISRVFLNIINNACYSTHQKKKKLRDAYNPVLNISTINSDRSVEIHIKDNGSGIPQEALDKIFNPFFTTKPAGEGTGLGLSLSFDIVVQEHQGELRVNSKEGEYAEFIIVIPKNTF